MFKAAAKPISAEPIGKYAIRFAWNDSHDLGIYSWKFLREVCPCAECKVGREPRAGGAPSRAQEVSTTEGTEAAEISNSQPRKLQLLITLSFLSQLNPQQREAVETTEGPVLILAGAGSGKTRVITYRIAYLIETMGVMPESILAMTFTNKAAAEMGERVEKLVGGLSIAKPVISTFHSFCVRVLRRDIEKLQIPSTTPGAPPIGLTKNFVIYDESDQQSLVKSAMKRMGVDDKQLTPRTVLSRISWAKNHMLDPQEIYLQSAIRRPNAWRTSTRSIARNCARRTPSISMTCCSRPCAC